MTGIQCPIVAEERPDQIVQGAAEAPEIWHALAHQGFLLAHIAPGSAATEEWSRVKPCETPAADDRDRGHLFQPDEITRLLETGYLKGEDSRPSSAETLAG